MEILLVDGDDVVCYHFITLRGSCKVVLYIMLYLYQYDKDISWIFDNFKCVGQFNSEQDSLISPQLKRKY